MTQPFADALSWVPKSRALGATLGRAHDLARARDHASVTLEHLLLALIEDPDASAVLLACNIDLLKLNAAAGEIVLAHPSGSGDMPEAAPALKTILEYAVAAARQSRRSEINGAIVLAAIIGEGKSNAARLLSAAGFKFQDAVEALKRGSAPPPTPPASQPPALPEKSPPGDTAAAAEPETEPQTARSAQQGVAANPSPVAAAPELPPPLPVGPPPASAPVRPELVASTPEASAPPLAAPHRDHDDDPVTTARLRIAAIRSGQTPPPIAALSTSVSAPMANGNVAVAFSPAENDGGQPRPRPTPVPSGGDWAPTPAPPPLPPGARPIRMPPPVPPVSDAPLRRIGIPNAATVGDGNAATAPPAADVPWADAATADTPPRSLPPRPPIDPAALLDWLPEKMPAAAQTTVEIRIPRATILATAAGTPHGNGRSAVLTRALAVRLRAPSGAFSIENASPETQWFDQKLAARDAAREEDEVRWRWVVTPRGRGRQPIQLSLVMRTVAADGMIAETILPDQQTSIRIVPNSKDMARKLGSFAFAALVGGILTLLASVGLAGLLAGVFK